MKAIGYTLLTMLTGGLAIPVILIIELSKRRVYTDKEGNIIYKYNK